MSFMIFKNLTNMLNVMEIPTSRIVPINKMLSPFIQNSPHSNDDELLKYTDYKMVAETCQ